MLSGKNLTNMINTVMGQRISKRNMNADDKSSIVLSDSATNSLLSAIEDKIDQLEMMAIEDSRKKMLESFIESLRGQVLALQANFKAQRWATIPQDKILNSPAAQVAKLACTLLETLKFSDQTFGEDLAAIKTYHDQSQKLLNDSRLKNLMKSVTTVTLSALGALSAVALWSVAGIIFSPVFSGIKGAIKVKGQHKGATGALFGTFGALAGLVISPITYVLGFPIVGGLGGIGMKNVGKKLTHIPLDESAGRFLFFQKSKISSSIDQVAKKGKALVDILENDKLELGRQNFLKDMNAKAKANKEAKLDQSQSSLSPKRA